MLTPEDIKELQVTMDECKIQNCATCALMQRIINTYNAHLVQAETIKRFRTALDNLNQTLC